tara:strand:+ start:113 stop:268 length:156 start_codon:yes stop_codon:yes gene_type:complete
MLTKKQIQATLKHCEKIDDKMEMWSNDRDNAIRNLGWIQALKYVLSEYDAS